MILTVNESIELFLTEQRLRGNSKETIRAYTEKLKKFSTYLENKNIENISNQDILNYQLYLLGTSLKRVSIKGYLVHLSVFLKYIYYKGYVPTTLFNEIRYPKVEKDFIEILSDDEIQILLDVYDHNDIIQFRNYCILLLLLDSGLRKNEVETLKISNIKFDKKYLIVDGKGNKRRAVPFGSNTQHYLQEYLKRRTPSHSREKYFFLDNKGEPLGKNCIKMMFQDLKRYVPRVHAHLCRHPYVKYTPKNNLGFFRKRQCGEEESGYFNPYNLSIAFLVINHTLPLFR